LATPILGFPFAVFGAISGAAVRGNRPTWIKPPDAVQPDQ
jgi:hypothetical protein